jgi:hypothetical protein
MVLFFSFAPKMEQNSMDSQSIRSEQLKEAFRVGAYFSSIKEFARIFHEQPHKKALNL